MKRYILLSAVFMIYLNLNAKIINNSAEEKSKAFVHAQIYLPDGSLLEDAIMIIRDGKIQEIGKDIEIPETAEVIEMQDKSIYPVFINAYSALGITEVSAVWQTNDVGEKEEFNPNIKVEMAVNVESEHIPVTRANGIAYNVTAPMSGIIAGTSALIQFNGWNWEEMLIKAPVSLIINWPTSASITAFGAGPSLGGQTQIDQLCDFFDNAKAYLKAKKSGQLEKHDLRFEAMEQVLDGTIPVWFTADKSDEIQAVLGFASHYKLKAAIVGGLESVKFAKLLNEKNIAVIIPSIFGMPDRTNPNFDAYYALPSKLFEAGIKYCIAVGGNMEVRNLPYHAGKAEAYGLSAIEAFNSVTQNAADVIGVGHLIGSLEVGKLASFIVTNGNPLELTTTIEAMYIQGEQVSLDNKHKALYEKYKKRYDQ